MSILSIPPLWLNIAAGILMIILGLAYIVRSGPMVKDFKIILTGLKRVLTMAFVWQGLTLCFIGGVVVLLAVSGQQEHIAKTVSSLCAGMLLILGIWTGSTGGQSEYLLFRIGQFALIIAAMMIFVGNLPR
jgi:membrane-anchored protein YejM (alkaline phosphatase superfamily)